MQEEVQSRAQINRIEKNTDKYNKRYPLSGILYCSKCGFVLKRKVWNSKHKCKKIVWQCSNYVKNGKEACTGTTIDDAVVSNVNIDEPTIVREVRKDGKKYYGYSCKRE